MIGLSQQQLYGLVSMATEIACCAKCGRPTLLSPQATVCSDCLPRAYAAAPPAPAPRRAELAAAC